MSKNGSAAQSSAEKTTMKTLANCTPVEFLRQTNRIKHAVEDLFTAADLETIRKKMPQLTGEETQEERNKALKKQGLKNFSEILDALMDANAEATAAVLGMMCFREPEEMAGDTMIEYLGAVMELLESKPVKDFLSLLLRLELTNMDG